MAGIDRDVVYSYIDAKQYLEKVNATGVSLSLAESSRGYYEEAKTRYLESLVYDARLLLDEEKFSESESKFNEIKRIEPNYSGIDEHMKITQSEPIYRQAKQNLEAGLYRKAYNSFNSIITKYGLYKDSKDLREEALTKATLTLTIGQFDNRTRVNNANLIIESTISTAISNIKSPFFKLVDTKNTLQFINQQVQARSTGSDIQVGQILAAKAIVNGMVIKFDAKDNRAESEVKRGYTKEEITKKDKVTGQETKEVKYHKVTYIETQNTNTAYISIQYQLSSTETGAILVSDALNITKTDKMHYAIFNGEDNKLVPGYWEHIDKESAKDRIDDNPIAVEAIRKLLKAKQSIKSAEALKDEALAEISAKVAQKIERYNPEE
jgi:hypothetical protein